MLTKGFSCRPTPSYVCLGASPGPHRAHPGKRRPGPAATLQLSALRTLGEGSAKPSPCSTPSSQSRMPPHIRQSPLPGARMPGCSSRWTRTR